MGEAAVAAGLAREIGAVHLRIDSIEQALRNSGVDVSGPEGYEVAYAIAEDNLRLGRHRSILKRHGPMPSLPPNVFTMSPNTCK